MRYYVNTEMYLKRCKIKMCLVLHNSFSGVLTGKYKRDEKLDHTSGRIAFVAKDESKAMQAAPAWSQYANNESYWSLIKTMEEIGKAHGN